MNPEVLFGTDLTGLTAGQLAAITFIDPVDLGAGSYPAAILSTGEIVAVPEPTAAVSLLSGLGLLIAMRRRRA